MIGASSTPGKVGMMLTSTLLSGGFKGEIYPVNPNAREVLGIKAYPNVKSIPEDVDLAVVTVPARPVVSAVRDCAEKGVSWCVIITAGFKEVGGEGEEMREEIAMIAEESGLSVVGPNCMGVLSASSSLHALMAPLFPRKGGVSIVSQSGTVGMVVMDALSQRGSGIAKFVSSGNETHLKLEDYLEFFADDPETRVVVSFIEGVKDGKRFMDVSRKITVKKPFVCIKDGRTGAGGEGC